MARSTGPIIAAGSVTLANEVIFHNQPVNWRIPVATGIVAISLALLERLSEGFAVGIAYLALVTVLLTRTDPKVPSPVESALKWYEEGNK